MRHSTKVNIVFSAIWLIVAIFTYPVVDANVENARDPDLVFLAFMTMAMLFAVLLRYLVSVFMASSTGEE